MNKLFYPRLALINMKNNSKTYIPYILASMLTVMMYYIMYSLSIDKCLKNMYGGIYTQQMLVLGTWVIAIFAVIFLLYTNSFLIKRRKKELGLFNILGMEKKHIGKIMIYETFYTSIISITLGILFGIVFSKLVLLFLLKLLKFDVRFGFSISSKAIIKTIALFVIIYLIALLKNLKQIHFSKPIELIHGDKTGEKEPKTKLIIAIIGFICLGLGYYISVTTTSPIAALMLFFIAVILVIIGTICLFTAGSILILKLLRKNKGYYYKTKNFISISGMMYRMKQNAVGLAIICILSTMVLVMISSTVSLYIGTEDAIKIRYPSNINIISSITDDVYRNDVDSIVNNVMDKHNIQISNKLEYDYLICNVIVKDTEVFIEESNNIEDYKSFLFISTEDYNKIFSTNEILADDEVLIYCNRDKYYNDSIKINNKTYKIKRNLDKFIANADAGSNVLSTYYFVVNDVEQVKEQINNLIKDNNNYNITNLKNYIGINFEAENQEAINAHIEIKDKIEEKYDGVWIESLENERNAVYGLYGGLFFLGIFLGLLFIMATVLIMYYKQISEGYDDKKRFEIMQNVGMSHTEIKRSIHSQVILVFFLPLVTATVHIAFAFPIILRLLAVINLTNVNLFAICTIVSILIFAVFYAIVYNFTAKAYYKIVS